MQLLMPRHMVCQAWELQQQVPWGTRSDGVDFVSHPSALRAAVWRLGHAPAADSTRPPDLWHASDPIAALVHQKGQVAKYQMGATMGAIAHLALLIFLAEHMRIHTHAHIHSHNACV